MVLEALVPPATRRTRLCSSLILLVAVVSTKMANLDLNALFTFIPGASAGIKVRLGLC